MVISPKARSSRASAGARSRAPSSPGSEKAGTVPPGHRSALPGTRSATRSRYPRPGAPSRDRSAVGATRRRTAGGRAGGQERSGAARLITARLLDVADDDPLPGRDRLRELLDAVLDEDNRTLPDMAGDAFASPWYFARQVSRGAGEPPVALRRRVLLERAAWQLRAGSSEIGRASG